MSIIGYRIIVKTNPERVTSLFHESGPKYLWSVRCLHDGDKYHMPIVAHGSADTKWGARWAARRQIKYLSNRPGTSRVVVDEVVSP